MHSRREFLQRAAALSGVSVAWGVVPESIARAASLDPEPGSTFLDADHVVILMQENRSFDHAYGALRGVRGFDDPVAFRLANGNPVWLQTNDKGETYCPFRMNMKETKATWMGSLPHSWENQNDARNHGYYDKWLQAKANDIPEYHSMPLTLGYYTREDIPYYYALADAFTICDQNFCSSLTGTTPNRLYLWTGTVRATRDGKSAPIVRNEEIDYPLEASYTTFPERLESHGISWKVYQNEINLDSGLTEDESVWLNNFSDNPLEWFTQYGVRHAKSYQAHLARNLKELPNQIAALKTTMESEADAGDRRDAAKKIADLKAQLKSAKEDSLKWSRVKFEGLSDHEKNLHIKAFTINEGDPDYRTLSTIEYEADGEKRQVQVPKGDVLHQFRKDVDEGTLPAVSWLVPPESFSDHPSSAWYGAWYVAETLNILTKNPDVWKKTIFILCYDENDGYFDHIPPFTAPHPKREGTGKVSYGIDTSADYLEMDLELKRQPKENCREGSIGLGYRVPLVIASPWSRGGMLSSEVFDHTSILRFLEVFLSHKTGRPLKEENISDWRRLVCGDLTSTFQPWNGEPAPAPTFPPRDEFIESIHRASFMPPTESRPLSPDQIQYAGSNGLGGRQEKGTRPLLPALYELYVTGELSSERSAFEVRFLVDDRHFGRQTLGAPFKACAYLAPGKLETRAYATTPRGSVDDSWKLADFADGLYNLRIDGPNGFYREFKGSAEDPLLTVNHGYGYSGGMRATGRWVGRATGDIEVYLQNSGDHPLEVTLKDASYGLAMQTVRLQPRDQKRVSFESSKSEGWYDLVVTVDGHEKFFKRFAGHADTGRISSSDPRIGRA